MLQGGDGYACIESQSRDSVTDRLFDFSRALYDHEYCQFKAVFHQKARTWQRNGWLSSLEHTNSGALDAGSARSVPHHNWLRDKVNVSHPPLRRIH